MNNLTASQNSAVEWRRKDACVVAGPGSGKTTVLVERYRSLIEDHGFEPHQILAITFTEKAAANMRARLADEFRRNPLRLRDLESAWVSTIHGFCARLLREHSIVAGIDPRFTVLDARESEELRFESIHRTLDDLMAHRRTEALALIEALHAPDIASHLVDVYDAICSSGRTIAEVRAMPSPSQSPEPAVLAREMLEHLATWSSFKLTPLRATHRAELAEWAERLAGTRPRTFEEALRLIEDPLDLRQVPPPAKKTLEAFRESLAELKSSVADQHTGPLRALVFDVLAAFEDRYRERKAAAGALDFNDLERRSIELLENHPETRERVRSQFRQVMLDEFQDINEQQWKLIGLVRNDDVFFAVGDSNQSIYAFRHARPEIFHRYQEETKSADKHTSHLFDNFRSREEILRCVEELTNGAEGIDPRRLIAAAGFPPKDESSVEAYKVTGADKDSAAQREAAWIAHRISALHGTLPVASGRPADFKDFAILCRNSDSMGPILAALGRWKIPYVCGRRPSFLVSRDGLDLTALLHVILNPRNTIALATVLRSPFVSLSDEGILTLRLLAGSLSGGLNAVAFDSSRLSHFEEADAAKLWHFATCLRRWRGQQPTVPLEVLISRVLTDCGIRESNDIASYLNLARTRSPGRDLAGFLRMAGSLETATGTDSELADADQGNCVQVMTAHAAKGLEFPVTIIAAMEKGTRRESSPVNFTPTIGLGLKWRSPTDQEGLSDSWHRRNSAELKQREKEESNRLLYVAMTRAEEQLILSYSGGDRQPSRWARLVENLPQLREIREDPPEPASTGETAEAEIPALPRPEVRDQSDTTVSVTSLSLFAQCPRKYYLQRYIGWNGGRFRSFDPEESPEGVAEDHGDATPAAELGSLVHALLAGKAGEYPEEARALAGVFHQSELGRLAAAASRSEREWDFIMDLDGTLVQGVIDLWFEHDSEIVIVDYKTDSKVDPDAYTPQLALYALALERALGRRPARAWLHYLRFDRLVEVPTGDGATEAVRELAARLKAAQNDLHFELNPDLSEGGHCRACPFYRSLCPLDRAGMAY